MSSGWESGAWVLDFIGSWEWTIPGGASEIQRTIIGERGLGLPREPVELVTSDFGEIHDELRSVARDLLGKGAPIGSRSSEAGWPGLEVPDDLGGAGASFVETAILLEEMGRAAATNRFLGTTLAVGALTAVRAQ